MSNRRKKIDLKKLNKLRSDEAARNYISSSDMKAIQEYENGKSSVDIAEEYGYSVASFYRLLNKADRIIKESNTQVNTVRELLKKMVNIPECMFGYNLAGLNSIATHKIVYITLALYQQKEELFISRKILQAITAGLVRKDRCETVVEELKELQFNLPNASLLGLDLWKPLYESVTYERKGIRFECSDWAKLILDSVPAPD